EQDEAHPVGTGAFKLAQWRRSSPLVPHRQHDFRADFSRAGTDGRDAAARAALVKRVKGGGLRVVDRVEISIIEEEQPRWLAFVNGEADVAFRVGYQFRAQATPHRKVAQNPATR